MPRFPRAGVLSSRAAALGLRKGELFALRKSDVDLARGTITVARSHERDTTKGGAAALLPLPTALRPWIEYQLAHAPGHLVFPAPDGSQRTREADRRRFSGMPWPAPASLKVTNTAVAGAPTGNAPAMRSRASVRRAARSPMGGAVHSPIHADGGSGPSPCTFPSASTTCATPSQPTAPPRSGLVPRPAPHAAQ